MKRADGLRTKWKIFKEVVQATWLWRVYCVCAMKRTWTKFLVAVFLICGYWVIDEGLDLLTPIIALEQMPKKEGVLLEVLVPLKSVHDSQLVLQLDDGNKIHYRGTLRYPAPMKSAIGQRITVWSQPVYEAWYPFYYECFRHVQQGEKVLVDYKNGIGRKGYQENFSPIFFGGAIVLTILSFLIVTWVCRKGECL